MQYLRYTDFVTYMVAKWHRCKKKQGKDLLQTLAKKIDNSICGGNIRQDVNDHFKCVTDNWIEGNYDDRVKEWWQAKNGKLLVKLEDDRVPDIPDMAVIYSNAFSSRQQ